MQLKKCHIIFHACTSSGRRGFVSQRHLKCNLKSTVAKTTSQFCKVKIFEACAAQISVENFSIAVV